MDKIKMPSDSVKLKTHTHTKCKQTSSEQNKKQQKKKNTKQKYESAVHNKIIGWHLHNNWPDHVSSNGWRTIRLVNDHMSHTDSYMMQIVHK